MHVLFGFDFIFEFDVTDLDFTIKYTLFKLI